MTGSAATAGVGRPCYLLPLSWRANRARAAELAGYLRRIASVCDILIVDGSPREAFAAHHLAWASLARHIPPDPALACQNGKVAGVLTGIRATTASLVIVADDDVRYDERSLAQVLSLLAGADLVIPQNYFSPLPWHAAWDSARSLINRALGADYPGTLAVRRAALVQAGGYDGNVLFENLELIRTLRAAGARVVPAPAVFVRRLPPGPRHFAGQRVRQAYDSLAQPTRLAAELALLPAATVAAARRPELLAAAAAMATGLAEAGRRRAGAVTVFPWWVSLLAPAWVAERSVSAWLALACRLRGGINYGGRRLVRAATPAAVLRARATARRAAGSPEPGPRM